MPLIGRAADGSFKTKAAQSYSSDMCALMASVLVNFLKQRGSNEPLEEVSDQQLQEAAAEEEEEKEKERGTRLPVPACGRCRDLHQRWTETFR